MKKILLCLLVACCGYGQSLNWAAKFSGSAHEMCSDAVTDAAGNVYAVGILNGSVDFDPGPGFFYLNESNPHQGDMYCVKLNRQGQLVWAKIVGGADGYSALEETTPTVSLDAQGNVFVAGIYTNQSDMDPGPATLFLPPPTPTFSTGNFISKFDNAGNLIWAKSHGAPFGSMWNRQLKTDAAGNVYLAGYFLYEMNFESAGGTPTTLSTAAAYFDGYVLKYDNDGNFVNALQIGSAQYNDYIRDFDVDPAGNFVVTGGYRGTVDFDPSDATLTHSSQNNGEDIFVAKYDTDFNLEWAHTFGRPNSSNNEDGHAIMFDLEGNVIVAGEFRSTADFNPDPNEEFVINSVGIASEFFLKLTSDGTFVWVKTIGAMSADGTINYSEVVHDLATDAEGNIYATGHYVGHMDADPSDAVYNLVANGGGTQLFNLQLDADGNFVWARSYGAGTNLSAEGRSIAVNPFNEIVVSGRFQGTMDFNPGGDPYLLSSNFSSYGSFLMSIEPGQLNLPQSQTTSIKVYPNPFSQEIYFSTDLISVELYDATGRLVHKASHTDRLTAPGLPRGVYFVKMTTDAGTETVKLFKI
jgi:hypothetical protein